MKKKWFIGIDISKKTLDVVIYSGNTKKADPGHYKQISNDELGFMELLDWFKEKKIKPSGAVVVMEHTGIYGFDICLFLEKKQIDYAMVSPLHINRSIGFVRGKNDKIDAHRLALYCYTHRDTLTLTRLKNSTVIQLKELCAEHKRYIKEVASHKGFLTDRQKREKTPAHERAEATIKYLQEHIKAIEQQMEEIINSDESFALNYLLLQSIKGIGPVNAINTLIYTNNFTCFDNARKYACYLGIAPFERSSGTSIRSGTRVSKYGNKTLKADLTQAAKSAVIWDTEMKEYYQRKIEEGKKHWVVMNAVKFKLVCRMFAVVNRGTQWVDMKKYAS